MDNPDTSGRTPLALAASKAAVMSSLCLLNHGAKIDAVDELVRFPPRLILLVLAMTFPSLHKTGQYAACAVSPRVAYHLRCTSYAKGGQP